MYFFDIKTKPNYKLMIITINYINEITLKNNCLCIDTTYKNSITKLNWICHKGHQWQRTWFITQLKNLFCKYCKVSDILIPRLLQKTDEKEGTVLLNNYFTVKSSLIFVCKNNHIWKTTVGSVMYQNTWCQICSGMAKHIQ